MVVPAITDLDLDTWDEKRDSMVNTKCYLTWDADFKWFDDASPEVPIMSGGLLALSNYWWRSTGGYDKQMRGWGGENLEPEEMKLYKEEVQKEHLSDPLMDIR